MRRFSGLTAAFFFVVLSCVGAAASSRAHAQGLGSTRVEINLDNRVNNGAGPSNTSVRLYNASMRVNSSLSSGLGMHFFGTQKQWGSAVQEASLSKSWAGGAQQAQAGVIRLPFGIYDYQETYASGIIDYPMPRVDYNYNSVDWGVPGLEFSGGAPQLRVEAAAFDGRASGAWQNRNSVGGESLRLQTYTKNGFILGASRWDGFQETLPSHVGSNQPVHLSGLDLRYTQGHWLLRGEAILGELAGDQMHGEYLDAYYRLPRYEKWTLAGRIEELRPGSDYPAARQFTVGVRYVATPNWTLTLNWRRNNMNQAYAPSWTQYSGRGTVLFQAYYRLRLGQ